MCRSDRAGLFHRQVSRARRFAAFGALQPPPDAATRPWSAGLRLVARRGRLATWRPAVLAGALLARAGLLDAYTLWPDHRGPLVIVRGGDTRAAAWIQSTFERGDSGRVVDAATWNALRARALLFPSVHAEVVAKAAAGATGLPARRLRAAYVSIAGASLGKLLCFVFDNQHAEPVAAVKVMTERDQAPRLRRETEMIEALRRRVAGSPAVAAALPLPPLNAGDVDGEYVVVEPVDPLATHTGSGDRETAMRWLRAFQAEAGGPESRWGADDLVDTEDAVSWAWARARPGSQVTMLQKVRTLSERLEGTPLPRCAVHGDFWRGNLAQAAGVMRVFDWEYAELSGRPFFDLWSYELAEIRSRAADTAYEPATPLAEALERVSDELARRDIPREFAPLTLSASIAALTFRMRRATGRPGGNEAGSIRVMAAAEELLIAEPSL
jgi:hypothetical protein